MAKKNFDVEVPDGQHLGFSRDTDGAYRAHLFDNETNGLVGHAELFETDWDSARQPYVEYVDVSEPASGERRELTDDELAELLGALVGLGIIVAAVAVETAPHVKKWWQDTAVPGIRSAGNKAVRTLSAPWKNMPMKWKATPPNASQVILPDAEAAPQTPSTELEVAFQKYRASMGSAEARERFVSALLARAYSDEQMRLLRSVRIEDDAGPADLRTAVETLTPQQVGETITLMIEKNPSLLTQASLIELRTILGGNQVDGRSMPLILDLSPLKDERESS
ncbi:hypothetical protein [Paenarthrobacter ilicis]|uniref:hypothetical protein n=1 Tax=Paenarthrobacter ilicis TaxID=43665 RepID=UPI00386EFEB6